MRWLDTSEGRSQPDRTLWSPVCRSGSIPAPQSSTIIPLRKLSVRHFDDTFRTRRWTRSTSRVSRWNRRERLAKRVRFLERIVRRPGRRRAAHVPTARAQRPAQVCKAAWTDVGCTESSGTRGTPDRRGSLVTTKAQRRGEGRSRCSLWGSWKCPPAAECCLRGSRSFRWEAGKRDCARDRRASDTTSSGCGR